MRQILFTTLRDVMANGADGPDGADARGSVLDSELILIVRVPARPSITYKIFRTFRIDGFFIQ
jgi:hypothetical protein